MTALRRAVTALAATTLTTLPLGAPPATAATLPARLVTTIAGDPLLTGPATDVSMTVNDVLPYDGDVLVASSGVVRRVDLQTGVTTVFAGIASGTDSTQIGDGGPATLAVLNGATSLAPGPDGSVYVLESTGERVRRIDANGVITTVAGSGQTQGFAGDGGPATAARFFGPNAIAAAPDGTLYVSDGYNNRIRAIAPDGTIGTVAGNGVGTFAGDGGPALLASLNQPAGLAVAADGSLLVADSENHRIRRIKDGVITTLAGIGTAGDPGDGQFGNGVGPNGDGGPAVNAVLHGPAGVSIDGDGVLVADTLNHKIRRIDANGVITTVAGGGSRGFGEDDVPALESSLFAPTSARRLADGRLLISDTRANRLRVVDTGGTIRALAGNAYYGFSGDGGPATSAQLATPHFLTTGTDGDAYFVSHIGSTVVRRVDSETGVITTVYGLGANTGLPPVDGSVARTTYLPGGRGLAVDRTGALFVVDGNVIRRVDPVTGRQRVYAGQYEISGDTGDGGHRLDATFAFPYSLYAAPDGSLYVGDLVARRVRRIAPDGTVHAFAGSGAGGSDGDGGPATAAKLYGADAIAGDAKGTVYIADNGAGRVRAVNRAGVISTVIGPGPAGTWEDGIPGPASGAATRPAGLVALPDGTLILSDLFAHRLRHYDPVTKLVTTLAGDGASGWRDGPAALARFSYPGQIGYDPVNERIVVADKMSSRIRAIPFTSGRTTVPLVSRGVLNAGLAMTVFGRALGADGRPVPNGTPVTLEHQRNGTTTWTALAVATSGDGGWVHAVAKPRATGRLRWHYAADAMRATAGPPVVVRATIGARWSAPVIRAGQRSYLYGTVRSATAGDALVVQRLVGGSWHPVENLTAGPGGSYVWEYQAFDRGDPVVRVHRAKDAAHPAAYSPTRTLTVE